MDGMKETVQRGGGGGGGYTGRERDNVRKALGGQKRGKTGNWVRNLRVSPEEKRDRTEPSKNNHIEMHDCAAHPQEKHNAGE